MDISIKRELIKRGDLILVNLGEDKIGSIQSGTRPMLVVSNNRGNRHSSILLTVPLSAKEVGYLPTHVMVTKHSLESGTLLRSSTILCEQLTTIDRSMLIKKIGNLSPIIMESKIKEALSIAIGLSNAPKSA